MVKSVMHGRDIHAWIGQPAGMGGHDSHAWTGQPCIDMTALHVRESYACKGHPGGDSMSEITAMLGLDGTRNA